jgi:hypothetical protein
VNAGAILPKCTSTNNEHNECWYQFFRFNSIYLLGNSFTLKSEGTKYKSNFTPIDI